MCLNIDSKLGVGMAAAQNNLEELAELIEKFTALANEIRAEGQPVEMVSTALMLASCNYSTYIAAGNAGYLEESGIDKLSESYKRNLTQLQAMRKQQFNPDAKD